MELDILSGSPAVGVPSHEGFLQNVSIREKADIFRQRRRWMAFWQHGQQSTDQQEWTWKTTPL